MGSSRFASSVATLAFIVATLCVACGGEVVVMEGDDAGTPGAAGSPQAAGTDQGIAPGPGTSTGTEPCNVPEACGSGRICLPDGKCHDGPSLCWDKACDGASSGACDCYWRCNDDRIYRAECKALSDGSVLCQCLVDGERYPWSCVVEEGGTDACDLGAVCCGFLEPS